MKNIYDLNKKTLFFYKACFDANKSPKDLELLKWQFFENMEHNFVSMEFDEDANKTVAIYATSSLRFKIDNQIVLGCQSLDTITDINYRGQGLFPKLANDVYSSAKASGVALVYGFPNGNSIYGFTKKLNWQVLDPLPFLIKPLKSKYFTNKIRILKFFPDINLTFIKHKSKRDFIITEEHFFPDEVDMIWNKFSKDIKVSVIRNKKYLEWRYIQKPNENYRIVHCYNYNNEYLGFIIFTVKEKHGGKIGYIMELMYNLENPKAGQQLMNYVIDKIKKQDADCVLAWCFKHSPNYKIYKRAFFMNMPIKFRPIELHFGVRVFQENLKDIIENRKNWFISYSDSDTV